MFWPRNKTPCFWGRARIPFEKKVAEQKRLEHEPELKKVRTRSLILLSDNPNNRNDSNDICKKEEWDCYGDPRARSLEERVHAQAALAKQLRMSSDVGQNNGTRTFVLAIHQKQIATYVTFTICGIFALQLVVKK